jgi:hypothetical protein
MKGSDGRREGGKGGETMRGRGKGEEEEEMGVGWGGGEES